MCVCLSVFIFGSMYKQRLNALAALVRGNLPSLHRNIITALITIDVHARDIVTELVKEKVCVFVLSCHRNGEKTWPVWNISVFLNIVCLPSFYQMTESQHFLLCFRSR